MLGDMLGVLDCMMEVLGYIVGSGELHGRILDYMVGCWVTW